ncbi:MAG: MFS transporter, partial [Immundisolibacteraceae bacterium]|nr:MFS transporter [Immundisolibacteraceae bacterium]
ALPVYLASELEWDFWKVGAFMAIWIIGYGAVQAVAPYLTGKRSGRVPDGRDAMLWALPLATAPAFIAYALNGQMGTEVVLLGGLMLFGFLFAVNSSLHSYLIVSYASREGASLDVGFYYMANAMGRLIGTLLSGWLYQNYGLETCLWVSAGFIAVTAMLSIALPRANLSSASIN